MDPADSHMEKVVFDLGPDTWHGFATESVWATRLDSGFYRIENTLFFAMGVSFVDVFETILSDGQRHVQRKISPSGHSTYRILILKDQYDAGAFREYWSPIEQLGCSYEHGDLSYQIYAVDVPPTTGIQAVFSLLEDGETNNVWYFEEGNCAHVL